MTIDGVTVEPFGVDPDGIGSKALDIDCDLDALALKVCRTAGVLRRLRS